MTALLRDSQGDLLRARTFSATAIHTPNPDKPGKTLCGGNIRLYSEHPCDESYHGRGTCNGKGLNEHGVHVIDLTICAGDNPQLCERCEKSVAKRQHDE